MPNAFRTSDKSSSYERSGADGTTVYCCPVCLRVELNSYEGWLWHLGSREHQENNSRCQEPFFNPRKGPNRPQILKRCVDVHGILGLKARELLEYFKYWGEIEDFSYWYKNEGEDGKAVRCVVLFKSQVCTDACLNEVEHKHDGKTLKVEPYKKYAHQGFDGGKKGEDSRKRKHDDRDGASFYGADSDKYSRFY